MTTPKRLGAELQHLSVTHHGGVLGLQCGGEEDRLGHALANVAAVHVDAQVRHGASHCVLVVPSKLAVGLVWPHLACDTICNNHPRRTEGFGLGGSADLATPAQLGLVHRTSEGGQRQSDLRASLPERLLRRHIRLRRGVVAAASDESRIRIFRARQLLLLRLQKQNPRLECIAPPSKLLAARTGHVLGADLALRTRRSLVQGVGIQLRQRQGHS
mmetsp:Transcript_17811/g.67620  ORF Transcript_17811/g.67620 Transcript_17811/m.67620 type:complete len:215 (+) Transcript_17811:522-1166(+)